MMTGGMAQSLVQAKAGRPDALLQVMPLSTPAAGVKVCAKMDGRFSLHLCATRRYSLLRPPTGCAM